jgi:hypothetical protein
MSLKKKWGVRKTKAAIKIQSWFRGSLQRRKYKMRVHLAKMAAVRNHEILLTLEELDRAVREREAAEKERAQADEDRRQAESERAETLRLKKKMIDAKRQAALDYKQTMYYKRDALGGIGVGKFTRKLVQNAAAITIQRAWQDFRIKRLPPTPDPLPESLKLVTGAAQNKRKEAVLARRASLFKATLPEISSLENSLEILPKAPKSNTALSQPTAKDNKTQAAVTRFQDMYEPDSYFSISRGTTPTRSQGDVVDESSPSSGVSPSLTPAGTLKSLAQPAEVSAKVNNDIIRKTTPDPPRYVYILHAFEI